MSKSYQIRATKNAFERWKNSTLYNLDYCYNSYSYNKEKAWEYCERQLTAHDGWGLRVVSFNSCIFTAGFLYKVGEKTYFRYITPSFDESVEVMGA